MSKRPNGESAPMSRLWKSLAGALVSPLENSHDVSSIGLMTAAHSR
jgi:hypothetical protein